MKTLEVIDSLDNKVKEMEMSDELYQELEDNGLTSDHVIIKVQDMLIIRKKGIPRLGDI